MQQCHMANNPIPIKYLEFCSISYSEHRSHKLEQLRAD